MCQKTTTFRVLDPGGSKAIILDLQGGSKWSFWTISDLILEHFGPHFGQVSYQWTVSLSAGRRERTPSSHLTDSIHLPSASRHRALTSHQHF